MGCWFIGFIADRRLVRTGGAAPHTGVASTSQKAERSATHTDAAGTARLDPNSVDVGAAWLMEQPHGRSNLLSQQARQTEAAAAPHMGPRESGAGVQAVTVCEMHAYVESMLAPAAETLAPAQLEQLVNNVAGIRERLRAVTKAAAEDSKSGCAFQQAPRVDAALAALVDTLRLDGAARAEGRRFETGGL